MLLPSGRHEGSLSVSCGPLACVVRSTTKDLLPGHADGIVLGRDLSLRIKMTGCDSVCVDRGLACALPVLPPGRPGHLSLLRILRQNAQQHLQRPLPRPPRTPAALIGAVGDHLTSRDAPGGDQVVVRFQLVWLVDMLKQVHYLGGRLVREADRPCRWFDGADAPFLRTSSTVEAMAGAAPLHSTTRSAPMPPVRSRTTSGGSAPPR